MKRLRTPLSLLLAGLLTVALAACSGVSGQRVEELKEQKGRVDVTAAEAEAILTDPARRGIVVLDIRTKPEYDQGHIADSYSVEVEAPTFGATLDGFSKAAEYMVYGTNKDDTRGASAADQMIAYGMEKVYLITDGYEAWKGDTAAA
jgi:rhodanese-related sulfurtransferase